MERQVVEVDPNGLLPGDAGCKLDSGKIQAALLKDFSLALTAVAEVCTYGAGKYSKGGWQHVESGVERYDNAQWRHMLAQNFEEVDGESGLPHIYHEAWNVLARLELALRAARRAK